MIDFGLVTEGISDQIVLENILYGFFNSRDIPIDSLQPMRDATDENRYVGQGNWIEVLEYCRDSTFKVQVIEKDFVIVQIDTDALKGDSVPENYRIDLNDKNVEETVNLVKNKLISLIGFDFYKEYQDKIIFAISVNSIECWLLPFYFNTQKIKAAKVENCISVLNEGLNKAGHKFFIKAKEPKYYRAASEPLKKHKEFLKFYTLNPSLKIFIEHLQNRSIIIEN
jgi:hypothetical protein